MFGIYFLFWFFTWNPCSVLKSSQVQFLEVQSFLKGSSNQPQADMDVDALDGEGAEAITSVVQILELVPSSGIVGNDQIWILPSTCRFICVQGKKDGPMLQHDYVLHIPGCIINPLEPMLVDDDAGNPTLSIQGSEMKAVLEHAWATIMVESNHNQTANNISLLPAVLLGCGL
jgi:hypothetical protein